MTIDLQAAQSAGYRDRGVARYALDYTAALVDRHPDLVQRIVLNPDLPPIGVERFMPAVDVEPEPAWTGAGSGGVWHALSPFELAVDLHRVWPPDVSRRGMRTVVTVYDLIPELFPDVYLRDGGLRRRYHARRELVRAADHVMTLSQSAADDVVEHLGVPASRVTMVGAAVGDAFRRPADKGGARGRASQLVAGIDSGIVVYNGAVEPRKNMEALLEAYALLPQALRASYQLVLVCRMQPLERNHFEVRSRQLGVAGRVVLTGHLPDAALVALYQAADLAVFPSLYEGFGLPVAEAMACGAPAIASGNSSLVELVAPEATFDPSGPVTIAAAMEAALTDGALRSTLERWSARPQPTWAEVADRAAAVYRSLEAADGRSSTPAPSAGRGDPGRDVSGRGDPGRGDPARGVSGAGAGPRVAPGTSQSRWRHRPLIALVTPWPPSLTGVASYNQRLVDALRSYADVEVYVDGDHPGIDDPAAGAGAEAEAGAAAGAGAGLHDAGGLERAHQVNGGYDAVILAVGNSEYHHRALRLLRTASLPMIVQAHDVRLHNMYLHAAARGVVDEGFEGAVADHYPGLEGIAAAGRITTDVAAREGIFMLSRVASASTHLLTTSAFAARLASLDCQPADRPKIDVWPYAYPAAVRRGAADVDADLICSFGIVNEAKRPGLIVAALASLLPDHPGLRLVFVGPVGDEDRDAVLGQAAELGVAAAVTLTGALDDDAYRGWLAAAGMAVQLRRSTNGETSGAVADCLSHGIPTVVSAVGPQAELAGVTAQLAAGAAAGDLARLLSGLIADPDHRAALGRSGLRWADERGFDWAARRLFELLPEVAPHGVSRHTVSQGGVPPRTAPVV